MKNKLLKIIFFILIVTAIVFLVNSKIFAVVEPSEVLVDTPIQGEEDLENLGENILGIITVAGIILGIIILIIVGIKYMTGSVEEKAGYKKSLMPYTIGCIILICAPTIVNIIYGATESFNVSQIISTAYHKNGCGKIEAYCTHEGAQMEQCYYCTGCEKIITIGAGTPYCAKCDVYYEGN